MPPKLQDSKFHQSIWENLMFLDLFCGQFKLFGKEAIQSGKLRKVYIDFSMDFYWLQ
jgi:hypothetical protein